MKKILGIIAEYNPLHNGHLYHIKEAQKRTSPDYTVCVMSGNFTQRGMPALIDKWSRTKMALSSGIDLVIELPLFYATSSAELFSYGAISILNQLSTKFLAFGSECSELSTLKKLANVFKEEPELYTAALQSALKEGLSFPQARDKAIISYFKTDQYHELLTGSNNLLGIEYLKAIQKTNSLMEPILIQRKEVVHNSSKFTNSYASGTTLRTFIQTKGLSSIKDFVPSTTYSILQENQSNFITGLDCFEKEILYLFRTKSLKEIAQLPDVTEGLENKIKKSAGNCNTLSVFLDMLKTKRYTYTRLQRICLSMLLNISKEEIKISKLIPPYLRILGMNQNGKKLISQLKKQKPSLSFITSLKKYEQENPNTYLTRMLQKDTQATDIYTLAYLENSTSGLDYTTCIIS